MRTTITIYRQLGAYIDHMDAAWASAHPTSATKEDPSIDAHFRSGVYLGVGMCNIVLSMMPGKLATLVELFGYKGDRKLGLEMLMRAGGWVEGQDEPKVGASDEGVRRTICDMSLLIFHLVLSSFTFDGVDISVANKVLKWNLKRYPNGEFSFPFTPPNFPSPKTNPHPHPRRILPLRSRPPLPLPLPTTPSHPLLHTRHGISKTIPQPPSHLLLGDCDCESGAVGCEG